MKLLVLGGTQFLGRAVVVEALTQGYEVTMFNRGQSNPDLFPDVETIVGDRDGGLAGLHGRTWDAVIDTCGYVPRLVRDSAKLLADAVDHYTFISTISVYADPSVSGIDEDSPLGTIEDETIEEVTGESYGPLKVLCEEAAMEGMNGRALLVRSGLIVGPHDPTDRFSYWPWRVAQGGAVLAPGDPEAPVQFVDVRDIAAWTVQATASRLNGPYNVTGPAEARPMAEFLAACRDVTGSNATFTWISDDFLQEQEVGAYQEMPLWVPAEFAGFGRVNCRKAINAGLQFRPLPETIGDTLAWLQTRPADYEWRGGLTPQREADLLQAWQKAA